MLLGVESKSDAVVLSLQEVVRRKRIDELNSMLGHLKLQIDLPKSRRHHDCADWLITLLDIPRVKRILDLMKRTPPTEAATGGGWLLLESR